MNEKPITVNRAIENSRYQEALKKAMRDVENPYEGDKHKAAQKWLSDRNLTVRSLRK